MSQLIVSALIRNEASKFLTSWLTALSEFADKIVILDDSSTDGSNLIPLAFDKVRLYNRSALTGAAWGKESSARAEQWEATMGESEEGDFIFVLDADMLPARDPRDLLDSSADAIAFALYDLWTSTEYRSDFYWRGHEFPRIWLVRRPPDSFVPCWNVRGVHCGHLPTNHSADRVLYAPRDYSLLHYAYSSPALRDAKWDQYRAVGAQLSAPEWQHAQSILDPSPNLRPLPFNPRWNLTLANSSLG